MDRSEQKADEQTVKEPAPGRRTLSEPAQTEQTQTESAPGGPVRKTPVFREEIRVLPSDADEFHHANNTRYVHWMQQAAVDHSAALGWDADRYLALGSIWVARRHIIDYIRPVFPGETMLAETWVEEMKHVTCIRKYRFTRISDNQKIAEAETRWAFVSAATGRPARVPEELKSQFLEIQAGQE